LSEAPRHGTPTNIRMNLMPSESNSLGYILGLHDADSMRLSFFFQISVASSKVNWTSHTIAMDYSYYHWTIFTSRAMDYWHHLFLSLVAC